MVRYLRKKKKKKERRKKKKKKKKEEEKKNLCLYCGSSDPYPVGLVP